MKITRKAFGAAQQLGIRTTIILPWSIAAYAREVRNVVGEVYDDLGNGSRYGWSQARKAGIRIIPVTVVGSVSRARTS